MGIFSPTKWVERVLTVHELARCLDLGESSLQAFEDKPVHAVPLATLPFLTVAPRRILAAIVKPWLQSTPPQASTVPGGESLIAKPWLSTSEEGSTAPTPSPACKIPSVESSFTKLGSQPNRMGEGQRTLEKGSAAPTSPHTGTISSEEGWFEKNANEQFGREKAARNDDAGIDTEFWDRQVVSGYRNDPPFRVRWDHFSSVHKKNPCSSLRDFLLRRWRRNVRSSFCRFMRQKSSDCWWCRPASADLSREWGANIAAGRDCIERSAYASWWDWDHGSRLFFWRARGIQTVGAGWPSHPGRASTSPHVYHTTAART
jgi:hypothetical protein